MTVTADGDGKWERQRRARQAAADSGKPILCRLLCLAMLTLSVCHVQAAGAQDAGSAPNGKTAMPNIFHWTLENGLDVFAVENHAAPLAYIEVAVKAGGITQTKETAGLFHLYEHMMFKGNSRFRTSAAVQKAIGDLGVPDWNGTTGLECVNYYFTVPKRALQEGMEFWKYALLEPLLDEDELEREKKVVLSEITANTSNPSYLAMKCALNTMFPDEPWRVDPSGDPRVVQGATVKQIKDIQKTYYVPNNAALFVAGDIEAGEVYRLAKELYGSWQMGADVPPPKAHTKTPLARNKFMISINDKIEADTAYITVYQRGPDVMEDEKDTYSADLTLSLFSDPQGPLVKAVMASGIGVSSPDRVGMGYQTRRAASLITYSAMLNGTKDLAMKANTFVDTVKSVCAAVASGKTKIPSSVFKRTRRRMEASDIMEGEMPDAVKTSLRYWWTVATDEYYYGYNKALLKTTKKDVKSFLLRYTGGNYLVILSVNSSAYEAQKEELEGVLFLPIQKKDALWWADASDSRQ